MEHETDILQELFMYRMERAFGQFTRGNKEYMESDEKASRKLEYALSICEDVKLRQAIDELATAYNECGNIYARAAYQHGFYDAVSLITRLTEIGRNKEK